MIWVSGGRPLQRPADNGWQAQPGALDVEDVRAAWSHAARYPFPEEAVDLVSALNAGSHGPTVMVDRPFLS